MQLAPLARLADCVLVPNNIVPIWKSFQLHQHDPWSRNSCMWSCWMLVAAVHRQDSNRGQRVAGDYIHPLAFVRWWILCQVMKMSKMSKITKVNVSNWQQGETRTSTGNLATRTRQPVRPCGRFWSYRVLAIFEISQWTLFRLKVNQYKIEGR